MFRLVAIAACSLAVCNVASAQGLFGFPWINPRPSYPPVAAPRYSTYPVGGCPHCACPSGFCGTGATGAAYGAPICGPYGCVTPGAVRPYGNPGYGGGYGSYGGGYGGYGNSYSGYGNSYGGYAPYPVYHTPVMPVPTTGWPVTPYPSPGAPGPAWNAGPTWNPAPVYPAYPMPYTSSVQAQPRDRFSFGNDGSSASGIPAPQGGAGQWDLTASGAGNLH